MKQETVEDNMPPIKYYLEMNDGVKDGSPLDKYADWIPQSTSSGLTNVSREYDASMIDYSVFEDMYDPDVWREDAGQ